MRSRIASDPDISFLLVRAFYDLRGLLERLISASPLPDDIQPGMGPILYALFERDDCTLRDLGERTQLAASTLTNSIDRMEKSDLVTKERCSEDGRAVRVRLTERAQKLQPDMNALRTEVRQALHGNLSEDDVRQTKNLLTLLIDQMAHHARQADKD